MTYEWIEYSSMYDGNILKGKLININIATNSDQRHKIIVKAQDGGYDIYTLFEINIKL